MNLPILKPLTAEASTAQRSNAALDTKQGAGAVDGPQTYISLLKQMLDLDAALVLSPAQKSFAAILDSYLSYLRLQ